MTRVEWTAISRRCIGDLQNQADDCGVFLSNMGMQQIPRATGSWHHGQLKLTCTYLA